MLTQLRFGNRNRLSRSDLLLLPILRAVYQQLQRRASRIPVGHQPQPYVLGTYYKLVETLRQKTKPVNRSRNTGRITYGAL